MVSIPIFSSGYLVCFRGVLSARRVVVAILRDKGMASLCKACPTRALVCSGGVSLLLELWV